MKMPSGSHIPVAVKVAGRAGPASWARITHRSREPVVNAGVIPSVLRILFAAFVLLPFSLQGMEPEHPGLIGLLEIPYKYDEQVSGNGIIQPLVLQSSPQAGSKPIGRVQYLDQLETYEWSYEQPGAAVYGYRHDGDNPWYRLRRSNSGGLAWVRGNADLEFHGLAALVSDSLAYLTEAWDKKVFGTAGDPATATGLDVGGREIPIAVAGSSMVERELWFLVVVLKESICSSSEAPSVLKSGWVPAHSAGGSLNVWFYSRGC